MTNKLSNGNLLKDTLNNTQSAIVSWIAPLAFAYALIIAPLLMFSATAESEFGSGINQTVSEGTASNKIVWLVLTGMVGYFWANTGNKELKRARLHIFLLFSYLLLEIVSAVWSDVPAISLRRSMQQALLLSCVVAPFVMVVDRQEIVDKVCWIFAAVIIINVMTLPLLGIPDFGYRGIYSQKNSLGQIVTTGFFFFAYASARRQGCLRWLFAALALLAIGLCIVSHSKTSIGLLFVTPVLAGLIISLSRIKDALARTIAVVMCLNLAVAVIAASMIIPFGISDISEFIFHDTTFTGRTKIWEFAGHYIDQAPFVGYGFGSFWGVGDAARALGEGFIAGLLQAHNGYVDVVLEMGYVGLLLVAVLTIGLFLSILRLAQYDALTSLLLLTCLLFVLLNNTMESSLFRSYVPLWMVFLLCCGVTWREPAVGRTAP
ncbi:O-antigen ligase family protein [Methylobacter sp.]|uniref:O-antigen ligase family protein n=1 Tax=Methylobacter sp. TaxID=2051955 RepID=UPI002FDD742C